MLSKWPWLVTGTLTGLVAYCNIPARWMQLPRAATLEWLGDAKLQTLDEAQKEIQAKSLWQQNGAAFMAVRRPG